MNQDIGNNQEYLGKFHQVDRPLPANTSSAKREEFDFGRFNRACDPLKPLETDGKNQQYYIDFSEARSGITINGIADQIQAYVEDYSSHQFLTGHIGGGKSTELKRLTRKLIDQGFHVVYFESDNYLDIQNVDIPDILVAIAGQVIDNLEKEKGIRLFPSFFKELLRDLGNLLNTPLNLDSVEISLGGELAKISANVKTNPTGRSQLRQFLDSRTTPLINSLNNDIFQPAIKRLREKNNIGLVVIVDNLERIANNQLSDNSSSRQEYIFIDRGEILTELKCHVVYTIPLNLLYSPRSNELTARIEAPLILPMILVQQRDGSEYPLGLDLLKQMVMARAFPQSVLKDGTLNSELIGQVFQDEAVLNRLCRMSGGHVRNLLTILRGCLNKGKGLISSERLERVLREKRDTMTIGIRDRDWESLRKVDQNQWISSDVENYQEFLRQWWVFEYMDDEGKWFGVNPILKETKQFQS